MDTTPVETPVETATDLYSAINKLANDDLISCYQIQPCKENNCKAVFIGRFNSIPTYTHKILHHNDYKLHIISYILTDNEIKNKIYKIIGVVVFKNTNENSKYSVDLSYDTDIKKYNITYNNHKKQITDTINTIDNMPENIIEYIIEQLFTSPLKTKLNIS